MATFRALLGYVEPATYLKWRYFKFVYLIDPICTGDVKVADIQLNHHTGVFFVRWENVPADSDWIGVHCFPSYEAAKRHLSKNIADWFQRFARVQQPLSATHN